MSILEPVLAVSIWVGATIVGISIGYDAANNLIKFVSFIKKKIKEKIS